MNAKTRGGFTALMFAARDGHADRAELLLAGGADVTARDINGSTASMIAEEAGHKNIAKLLNSTGTTK